MGTTTLSPIGDRILNFLNTSTIPRPARSIGGCLDMPTASVRRWIGTLRDRGYNIITERGGYRFRFDN